MADKKITELNENTTPATEDILIQVDDPSGTPETKKITVQNLLEVIPSLSVNTTPASGDYLMMVDDPGGSPEKQHITIANVLKAILTTNGDILYRDNSGNITRLGIGSANKVLAVDDAGTGLEWTASAGGGASFTLIDAGTLDVYGGYMTETFVANNFVDQITSGWTDPAYVHDNNLGTYAHATLSTTPSIAWDMGSLLALDAVRLYNLTSSDYPSSNVKVWLSDTGDFTGEETLCASWATAPSYSSGWTNWVFDEADSYVSPCTGRYLKVEGYKASNWWRIHAVAGRYANYIAFANVPYGVTIEGYDSSDVKQEEHQQTSTINDWVMFSDSTLDRFIFKDPGGTEFYDTDDHASFSVTAGDIWTCWAWSE
jgi:hypothetical protein